jgi:hypothetical protein
MALIAFGGEFSDICTSRSLFFSPMTTITPSSDDPSTSSFKSAPPTQRHPMGLKLESGLSSGSEYIESVLLHSTHALLILGSSNICCTPGPPASLCGGSSLEAIMAMGSSEGSSDSGGRRTKWMISAAEVPT